MHFTRSVVSFTCLRVEESLHSLKHNNALLIFYVKLRIAVSYCVHQSCETRFHIVYLNVLFAVIANEPFVVPVPNLIRIVGYL